MENEWAVRNGENKQSFRRWFGPSLHISSSWNWTNHLDRTSTSVRLFSTNTHVLVWRSFSSRKSAALRSAIHCRLQSNATITISISVGHIGIPSWKVHLSMKKSSRKKKPLKTPSPKTCTISTIYTQSRKWGSIALSVSFTFQQCLNVFNSMFWCNSDNMIKSVETTQELHHLLNVLPGKRKKITSTSKTSSPHAKYIHSSVSQFE